MKSHNTSWGGVANWYDDLLEKDKDSFQQKVILPNLIRIVEPNKGMKMLDLACGQGYFAREFYEKGADVVACDISEELVELAQKHSKSGIKYFVSAADNFTKVLATTEAAESGSKIKLESDHFDVITIVLALQNIENLAGVFEECAKALKPQAKLIFVLNHPAFRIPKRSSWQWDGDNSRQFRRIDAYMSDSKIEIDMTPGENNPNKKQFTVSFHRPLQVYFKALSKSGFAVTRLEEWISHKVSEKGPRGAEEDRIRKEIPMFLCVEAKKY